MRRAARRYWVLALASIGLVGLTEIALRAADYGPGHAPLDPDKLLHHVHPKNYRYLAYSRTGEYGGFHVNFDRDGLRVSGTDMQNPASDCRIAFLGDSFTEGIQVRFEASFVGLLSSLTPCEVKNYGVGSYSPIFYAIQWQNIVRQTRPSLVVLQLFSDDVASDEAMLRQAVRDASGTPVALPHAADSTVNDALRRVYILRVARMLQQRFAWWFEDTFKGTGRTGPWAELNPDISDLTSDLVLRVARGASEVGAKLIVFAIPAQRRLIDMGPASDQPEFSDKVKAWAERNSIAFIDLPKEFRGDPEKARSAFLLIDGHYNEVGHSLTARALCREIEGFFSARGSCASLGEVR
jgi:hypothetical protein